MDITRKSFLSGAAIGLAGLIFLPGDALGAAAFDEESVAGWLRNAVGETFTARSAEVTVMLRLDRAEELRSDGPIEQFRFLFSAEERDRLAEGTWRLTSTKGRRVGDVFLVPAGTNALGAPLCRADFCLLVKLAPPNPRR